jgi:hypothetical protein
VPSKEGEVQKCQPNGKIWPQLLKEKLIQLFDRCTMCIHFSGQILEKNCGKIVENCGKLIRKLMHSHGIAKKGLGKISGSRRLKTNISHKYHKISTFADFLKSFF